MAAFIDATGGRLSEPLGYLAIAEAGTERSVPIFDQLFIGRECAGISEQRRLVIAHPEISRTHLEIRLDAAGDQAFVIDTSSNGTSLNGVRLERAVPVPIRPGDEIRIGDVALIFRSRRFTAPTRVPPPPTPARVSQTALTMVVGDIVNYSTISQATDEGVIAQSLHTLWYRLGSVLRAHHGTLSYYAGDALFAFWEMHRFPDAAELAIDFALAANRLVDELAPDLPLRDPDGSPIHMGWGVVAGMAAVAPMTRTADAVIGDSTNVAFRLAGIAGRNGRAAVLATSGVHRAAKAKYAWGKGQSVELKGRRGMESVFPVVARKVHASGSPSGADVVAKPAWGTPQARMI
jgi:class 3 adenylate cyclase